MYSLKCNWYKKEFPTIRALVDDILESGMDPNYEITFEGGGIGQQAFDFIQI